MTESGNSAVKQCHADPNLAWLRRLLAGGTDASPPGEEQCRTLSDEGLGALIAARSGDASRALAGDARQLAMRELAHQQALQRLASACSAQSLDVLVIKGEALARTLHGTPCVRTRADIDLWVGSAQLPSLCAVLSTLGYPAIKSIQQQWARFEVVHAQAQTPSVAFDVHLHPFFRPRLWQRRPFDSVWADAVPLAGLQPLRAPQASDSFAIAALHLAKNPHKRWIWLYDIDQFCRHQPDAVIEVCQRAAEWGVAALVADALSRAVSVFDTPLPCALPMRQGDELSASLLRQPGRLTSLARDLKLLPGWRARLAFVRELFERV
jgi:hypothetical protein